MTDKLVTYQLMGLNDNNMSISDAKIEQNFRIYYCTGKRIIKQNEICAWKNYKYYSKSVRNTTKKCARRNNPLLLPNLLN